MLDKSVLEKLIDRTPIAIILVGVVVFIIGAAGGFPVGNPPLHVADFAWRIGLGVMGLILVVIGVLLLWREGSFSKKDFDIGNETLTLAEFPTLAAAVPLLSKITSYEQENLSLAIIASTG